MHTQGSERQTKRRTRYVVYVGRYMDKNREITRIKREEIRRLKEHLSLLQQRIERYLFTCLVSNAHDHDLVLTASCYLFPDTCVMDPVPKDYPLLTFSSMLWNLPPVSRCARPPWTISTHQPLLVEQRGPSCFCQGF